MFLKKLSIALMISSLFLTNAHAKTALDKVNEIQTKIEKMNIPGIIENAENLQEADSDELLDLSTQYVQALNQAIEEADKDKLYTYVPTWVVSGIISLGKVLTTLQFIKGKFAMKTIDATVAKQVDVLFESKRAILVERFGFDDDILKAQQRMLKESLKAQMLENSDFFKLKKWGSRYKTALYALTVSLSIPYALFSSNSESDTVRMLDDQKNELQGQLGEFSGQLETLKKIIELSKKADKY
ncbi:MAG: hypothetical protein ACPGJV_07980 [Bacteriovoracaceae bacterium]